MNETTSYSGTAILLHWLVALLILAAFPLGLYMTELALSPAKLKLISYHKWIGVTIFLLVLIRLGWRFTHRPPGMPGTMPAWQIRAAHGLHHLLYLLMLAIPLSGWLMSSAKGFQTVYLGLVPLPDLVGKNKELGEALEAVHEWLNYTLLLFVAIHVAAAYKHHLIDRDGVLERMLPFLKKESPR